MLPALQGQFSRGLPSAIINLAFPLSFGYYMVLPMGFNWNWNYFNITIYNIIIHFYPHVLLQEPFNFCRCSPIISLSPLELASELSSDLVQSLSLLRISSFACFTSSISGVSSFPRFSSLTLPLATTLGNWWPTILVDCDTGISVFPTNEILLVFHVPSVLQVRN